MKNQETTTITTSSTEPAQPSTSSPPASSPPHAKDDTSTPKDPQREDNGVDDTTIAQAATGYYKTHSCTSQNAAATPQAEPETSTRREHDVDEGIDDTNLAQSTAGGDITAPMASEKENGNDDGPVLADVPHRTWAADVRQWMECVPDAALEKELFNSVRVKSGFNFKEYTTIDVRIKGDDFPDKIDTFAGIKLHPQMVANLKLCDYEEPTPIQKYALPIINARRDLLACAQTGSGKTAAYLVPITNKLLLKGQKKMDSGPISQLGLRYPIPAPLALILSPTRELAVQIFQEARKFAYDTWVRPAVAYGGAGTNPLLDPMRKYGCDVLVATPGRLADFVSRGVITMQKVRFLVIDEADRMMESQFLDGALRFIVKESSMPEADLTTCMCSATFPVDLRRMAKQFLVDPLLVTVGAVGKVPSDIEQMIQYAEDGEKRETLMSLFEEEMDGLALIFVATKMGADSLDDWLYKQGVPITSIHSGRTQEEREDSIAAFRKNKCPLMIATDIAARGWDIPNVTRVINFDMPNSIDDYIHRIGRTARVGNKGTAISFYNNKDAQLAPDLVRILKSCNQPIPDFLAEEVPMDDEGEEGAESPVDELKLEDFEEPPPADNNATWSGFRDPPAKDAAAAADGDGGKTGGSAWDAGSTAYAAPQDLVWNGGSEF
ncbi:hypothetical protein SmJEL517_g05229 [Synchytrium microbalum]|uniref:RNA helicase n=1 Tax=Synchytrium microbalum TaxID=1806994 RepID=A0A507BWB3_9FUNG|nr:uncharacterized protein SmJEL517_g05229 [Synchytrium microbalum]TPX31411.1 hypothetical protein SmJEL517_g05229 [Synchytrium microbalum]